MRGKLVSRTAVIAAAVALSAAGFTGTALAGGSNNSGGNGGGGGNANANCLIPIGVSAGVIGQGGNQSQCDAVGGDAGNGGNGVG